MSRASQLARIERIAEGMAALITSNGPALVAQELAVAGFLASPWRSRDLGGVTVTLSDDEPQERRRALKAKVAELDRRGYGHVLVIVVRVHRPLSPWLDGPRPEALRVTSETTASLRHSEVTPCR